MPDRKTEVFS